jgi:hypothetical protein
LVDAAARSAGETGAPDLFVVLVLVLSVLAVAVDLWFSGISLRLRQWV